MEFNNWFMEYTGLEIAGMIGLLLIFLVVFFEAIWLIFMYMWNLDDLLKLIFP